MFKTMKLMLTLIILCFSLTLFPWKLCADDSEFNKTDMSFKNFITCELTRTDAENHFNGKPFTITMIDLFDVQTESDVKILTGAVKCFVDNTYLTLYVAVGVTKTLGKEQISYYTIRNKDFTILATELIRFPYKERCKWSQYRVDID
ncbi:MAG: hypothetical protein A2328_05085 [Bdellovibrionales bacterium RIFOXYB2_FULL_36_6]|nr:MAG: hypothetical protein A2328_05085 [Bdellovibrionales bacterium RIFOXYB2_FULL_36_6]